MKSSCYRCKIRSTDLALVAYTRCVTEGGLRGAFLHCNAGER